MNIVFVWHQHCEEVGQLVEDTTTLAIQEEQR